VKGKGERRASPGFVLLSRIVNKIGSREEKEETNHPARRAAPRDPIRSDRIVGSGARALIFPRRVQQEAHDLCRQSRHVGVCISSGNTARVRFEFLRDSRRSGAQLPARSPASSPVCLYLPLCYILGERARSPLELSRTRDGRRRIVLPILPSSMTLGDDHREGANVLLPPAVPPSPVLGPFALRRPLCPTSSSSSSSVSSSILPPAVAPFSLPRPPFPPLPPPLRVPYARVIITAAIRHASLATLCPGESSRRGTTIARGSDAEVPTPTMTPRERRDIARCYRGIFLPSRATAPR